MLSIKSAISFLVPVVSFVVYQAATKADFLTLPCALVGYDCPSNIPIHGFVDDNYKETYNVFVDNIKKGREVGAGLTVYVDGKKVVSLQGGWQDVENKIEYTNNTLQMVFSSTKALSAIVIAQLVDQGLLSYDERISTYWPEFAQNNKENVTLMDLMRHTAGIGALDTPLSMANVSDPVVFAEILASQPHNFDGKPVHSYHAITQGWYQNEIIRRVDPQHRTIDDFAREYKEAYGSEWYLKPDATEGVDLTRIAPFYQKPKYQQLLGLVLTYLNPYADKTFINGIFDKNSLLTKTIIHPNINQKEGIMNNRDPENRAIEGPSYSGHTNADSMAKIGAMMANRGKAIVEGEPDLFTKDSTYQEATAFVAAEDDAVFPQLPTINQRGGLLIFPSDIFFKLSDNDTDFVGGTGAGGSLFVWNEKYNIAIAYVMNGYGETIGPDVRTASIVRSVYEQVKRQKSAETA
ncbi:beta-lactamase/transpeptidase-like protein [Parasitella parasitica]|nr:beta-lactamase/transpeptidase-like protein [Parasitella parasitica]